MLGPWRGAGGGAWLLEVFHRGLAVMGLNVGAEQFESYGFRLRGKWHIQNCLQFIPQVLASWCASGGFLPVFWLPAADQVWGGLGGRKWKPRGRFPLPLRGYSQPNTLQWPIHSTS